MQHVHHRVPVTALAIWSGNVILAGEGSLLRAYSADRKVLLGSARVFTGQVIHGLIVQNHGDSSCVLAWGGSRCCVVALHTTDDSRLQLLPGEVSTASDWILDAAFSAQQDTDELRVAFVTAHNALVVSNSGLELQTLVSGSNCILYCAHVTWLSASRCLIASGTAFGDIIVWSCDVSWKGETYGAKYQTHYTFLAHQGSVFGVQLATIPARLPTGQQPLLLASCSDDRTIRLWDVSDLTKKSLSLTEQQRETGFGQIASNSGHAPALLAKVMGGHLSRIWHVRFVDVEPVHTIDECLAGTGLLSFGEDAVSILWAFALTADEKCSESHGFRQLHSHKLHSGKNVWSVATDRTGRITTGGADGAVASWYIPCGRDGCPQEISSSPSGDKDAVDVYRSYAFLEHSELLAATNSGLTILLTLTAAKNSIATKISRVTELQGYSIMAGANGHVLLAGADGTVHYYSPRSKQIGRLLETGRKVASLFTSSTRALGRNRNQPALFGLIVNVGSSAATLCFLDTSKPSGALHASECWRLLLPAGFVTTSFTYLHDDACNFVVLGSRSGALAIFQLSVTGQHELDSALVAPCVHGKEAVTCLKAAAVNDDFRHTKLFWSTGRDGTYAAHTLQTIDGRVVLDTVHQVALPFGPNIEGLGYSSTGHIWTWGFRSKQFVVFDVTSQQEVMTVECGGAHRTWAFQPDQGGGTFVWTKASRLYYQTQRQQPYSMLNSGGHGREIKAAAVSRVDQRLIATGAEDTNIKLSVYEDGGFRCLHTLPKHTTGIQGLQWSADDRYLFSSGGFEEFFVWRVRRDVAGLGIGVVCESAHPNNGHSDLRITNFAVHGPADDASEQAFSITMVYSDSSVRVWHYRHKTWQLRATGTYLTSCLTQCLRLRPPADPNLLTGSTDGHLASWTHDPARRTLRWTRRHRIHQSAILSLASHRLADDSALLLTGGDDNAIALTRASPSGALTPALLVPRAHAAAVTALAVVHRTPTCIRLVSSGIDQRVKMWEVTVDGERDGAERFEVRLLRDVPTAVADVSGMEVMRLDDGGRAVLVCGVGMDVWRVDGRSGEVEGGEIL